VSRREDVGALDDVRRGFQHEPSLRAVPPELLGIRYSPQRAASRGHVESWFAKATAPDGRRALWVRCTIFARPKLEPVAEAWAVAFDRHRGHVAVKSTVLLPTARFSPDSIDVSIDGTSLTMNRARGSLSSGRGSLMWDLDIGPPLANPIFHIATRAMYRDGLPPFSKAVTPLSDARSGGVVRVDRGGGDIDNWDVDSWPTMIGHNWGRQNAELYAWTHCNAFEVESTTLTGNRDHRSTVEEHLAFEAVSTRVRIGPVLSPMATVAFVRWRGRSWDLSRITSLTQNRGVISLRRWEMTGQDRGLHVVADVAAETDDIVGLHYPNPNGPMTHCLNTKIARARLELRLPDGETVTATSRAAALEIGTLRTDHGIRMYL
jgi:hypothetical protein